MIRKLFLVSALSLLSGCGADPSQITISGARIAASTSSAAIYLTLSNAGGGDRLTGIDTAGLGPVTLHHSSMAGGVMRMRALPDGIAIPAGQSVVLAPGGLHGMIAPLDRPLKLGERMPLTLRFQDHAPIRVETTITAPSGMMH